MGERTKGRAYDAPGRRTIYHESSELALAYGGTSQQAEANAARLAAGCNLLETLEEMGVDALHFATATCDALDRVGDRSGANNLRLVRAALLAALSPSTPSGSDTE